MLETAATEAHFLTQLADCQGIVEKIARVYGQTRSEQADLRQDILMQAWRAWPKFRGDSKFSTWLYKIGLNTALMHRRSAKPPTANFDEKMVAAELPVEPIPTDLDRLYSAIEKLNEAEKSLVLLWLDELSYEEISSITGMNINNLGVKLTRIRAKLKLLMTDSF
jgi:RNA polymerase sigma factor (sigma-70 family)